MKETTTAAAMIKGMDQNGRVSLSGETAGLLDLSFLLGLFVVALP
jgi:hypothetical protein